MENLRLTYEQWYDLALWERERWLAREVEKEETYHKLIESLRDKQNNTLNRYGINAVVMLQAMLT